MTRLTFTEGNHQYRLDKQRIRSVTGMLGVLAKPALVKWAARVTAEYAVDNWTDLVPYAPSERARRIMQAPDQARNTAAAKGTQIHAWAEALLAGDPVDIPDEYAKTVQIFAHWWMTSGFVVERTECLVWSEESEWGDIPYAGKYDALALHPKHGWTLLDWKTGGVWPEAAVQLAAYADAEQEVVKDTDQAMQHIDTLAAVNIRPDGTSLHVVTPDQWNLARQRWHLVRALCSVDEPQFSELIA